MAGAQCRNPGHHGVPGTTPGPQQGWDQSEPVEGGDGDSHGIWCHGEKFNIQSRLQDASLHNTTSWCVQLPFTHEPLFPPKAQSRPGRRWLRPFVPGFISPPSSPTSPLPHPESSPSSLLTVLQPPRAHSLSASSLSSRSPPPSPQRLSIQLPGPGRAPGPPSRQHLLQVPPEDGLVSLTFCKDCGLGRGYLYVGCLPRSAYSKDSVSNN